MLQRRAVLSMHLCPVFQPASHGPSERTSRCAAPNHSHRIISIPYRRGIDVYCFAIRYIALEAWRTQIVAVRAAALLEHLWLAHVQHHACVLDLRRANVRGAVPQEDSHGWFTQARTRRLQ